MCYRVLIICGVLCLSAGQGCEPRIPNRELGTVIFELPNVPGGDKRPPTPELNDLAPPKDGEATRR
jgi:hypothetical protein